MKIYEIFKAKFESMWHSLVSHPVYTVIGMLVFLIAVILLSKIIY